MNEILIAKTKKRSVVSFKVTKKKKKGYSDPEYLSSINVKDPEQLATLLSDLKIMFDAPIDKAYSRIKKRKGPFW